MDQTLFGEKFSHHERDIDMYFEDAAREAGAEQAFQ